LIASLSASSRRLALRLQKEGAGRCIGAPNHQSRGHVFHRHTHVAQSLPWVVGCVCFAYVWAGLGHSRSRVESKSEQFRKQAVQKASSSKSEQFRKRALQKASSLESEQFRKRALQKASTLQSKHVTKRALHKASASQSERFTKRALHRASTSESKHFRKQALHEASTCAISTSQYKASSEYAKKQGRRASYLKARIQQCTGVS
jgi:flagellar biosynthesis GTPase FlhF